MIACADCGVFEATETIDAGFAVIRVCAVCAEAYPARCRGDVQPSEAQLGGNE